MSGHSKWANIKRQKNAQDRERAKVFSKLSKLITTAVKEGGSPDPEKNVQLRQVIERAKEEDMPKDNIKRAIENAVKKAEATQDIVLEGYGPNGLAVLMKAATDNRQRTIQEVKNIFGNNEGNLAEPGSVSYKFSRRGRVVVRKPQEEAILELIDYGVEEIEENKDELIIIVKPDNLKQFVKEIEEKYDVLQAGVELVAKEKLNLSDMDKEKKIKKLVNTLQDHPDIEKVFTNE